MEITIKINGQAVSVEICYEVYEYLEESKRKTENLSHQKRRHWDEGEFDEYIIATECSHIYTPTRLQNRLQLIQEENINTDKLHLAISSLGISDGLIQQIKAFVKQKNSRKGSQARFAQFYPFPYKHTPTNVKRQ